MLYLEFYKNLLINKVDNYDGKKDANNEYTCQNGGKNGRTKS